MRKIAPLLALLATVSYAGENRYLGQIVVSGASLTNLTTAAPFIIPAGQKITVYCTAAVNMLVDNQVVTAVTGLPLGATTLFPTSVGRAIGLTSAGNPTAVVAVIGTATCSFWSRDGNE